MRPAVLVTVCLVLVTAIVAAERRHAGAAVSPAPILYFVADTERELTRLPVKATRLSDDEERRIGDRLAKMYEAGRSPDAPEDPDVAVVQAYIARVGGAVAARAHRKLPYRFSYIPNTGFVNAFALPGGHIYIGGGLISLMHTEDELAAVLGHEIEHVDHYHSAERVQLEARLRRLPVLSDVLAIPIGVFQAGYSKEEELEADREGTRLAAAAGYAPTAAIALFETMQRLEREDLANRARRRAATPQEELATVGIETIGGYFKSHPPPDERIAQIRRTLATDNLGDIRQRPLLVEYVFITRRARGALDARHYDEAVKLAAESLLQKPGQPKALEILAQGYFIAASFTQAADTYRHLLEITAALDGPPPVLAAQTLHDYADALAAAHADEAAAIAFENWLNTDGRLASQPEFQADVAGMRLIAGDDRQASAILERVRAVAPPSAQAETGTVTIRSLAKVPQESVTGRSWPAEAIGRLGHWYYRAARYRAAAELLAAAVQERPGDVRLRTALGWALLELRNHEDALQRFQPNRQPVGSDAPARGAVWLEPWVEGEPTVGRTVTLWRAGSRDEAVEAFAWSIEPRRALWLNERWVTALYSSSVAQSIDEIRLERDARRSRRTGLGSQPASEPEGSGR